MFTYRFPRAMVTADAVLCAVRDGQVHVLLVQRKNAPDKGKWCLPGGFIEMDETLEQSASRELREETGVTGVRLHQFHTFGDPGRDPRGRSITVAYLAFVDAAKVHPAAGDDAAEADWFPIHALPEMAFDHVRIALEAQKELRMYAALGGLGEQVLPETFTMDALRAVYDAVLDESLDPEWFERDMVERQIVLHVEGTSAAADPLFRFNPEHVAPV